MQSRRLLSIDFSCALAAGAIYIVFFKFLSESLAIPTWLIFLHVVTNCCYGLFGVWIFVSSQGAKLDRLFRILALMNVAYLLPCFGLAAALYLSGSPWGGMLLLIEGVFVGSLGRAELRVIEQSSTSPSL